MSNIAHPLSGSLDTASKFFRVILKAGVSIEELMLPIQSPGARSNFVAFLAAGCPKFTLVDGEAVATQKSSDKPKALADLLEQIGEPTVLTDCVRFVAREKFVVNRQGELSISYIGRAFKTNFLDVVEENVVGATVKQRKLCRRSVDGLILSALGGEEKAKIALAHAFEFLKTADRNRWFIFYVADAKGNLWAVNANWNDDGWRVDACSVTSPLEWSTVDHVVSR